MNPYAVLGVPQDADDQTIRRAYLALLKGSPPETDPARFQSISAAYESIKDERHRMATELFDCECPGSSPQDAVLQYLRTQTTLPPVPWTAMKDYLRACLKS